PGLRPRALPTTPVTVPRTPMSAATPYRNNLQSLVRAQESKKYDLEFLDEQMLHLSDSDDDNGDSDKTTNITLLADHDVQSALPDIPKEDAERLQGKLCDRADDDKMSNDSMACQSDSSSTSSLSVYVAVVVPKHSSTARASAERVAFMLDIAARSLDLPSVADSCRVLTMFVASLLDHGNCLYHFRMQQSLASLLDRVSPASKWSLVWGELIAELGRLFVHLQIQTQLGIVEHLPASNKRCMQIRRSLSFLFLRKQSLDGSEGDVSLDSLARAATLPSQIVLRVVSEMMHGGEQPFRMDSSVDFAQLEAAVGLLSNTLDSVQAMHDVRDVARAIYQRLCAINRRISDGIADNIDKTLAKDAVQTLVVRLFMTAISDSTERLSPVYSSTRTLDNWLNAS
ncbi:hypothetical protein H4R27_005208, partial [Coemansia aciculifera]